MDILNIINYLEDNGMSEVEEIKQDSNMSLIKFYYDFDKDELSAAKIYSNEESDYESESEEWYNEYYIPFLKDTAVDNAEATVEDVVDEFDVAAVVKELGVENGNYGYFKFVLACSDQMDEMELEEILNDYEE